jgi:hypothetical protein
MNEDHADGNKAYVCAFTDVGVECAAAIMTTLNVDGFVMDVTMRDGSTKAGVPGCHGR